MGEGRGERERRKGPGQGRKGRTVVRSILLNQLIQEKVFVHFHKSTLIARVLGHQTPIDG